MCEDDRPIDHERRLECGASCPPLRSGYGNDVGLVLPDHGAQRWARNLPAWDGSNRERPQGPRRESSSVDPGTPHREPLVRGRDGRGNHRDHPVVKCHHGRRGRTRFGASDDASHVCRCHLRSERRDDHYRADHRFQGHPLCPCRGRYRFRDRLLRKVRACGADWAHRHGSRARVFLECR